MPSVPEPRAAPTGTDLRRAILDEARRLLVADGYERLSMRKIAAAVGCSATSIYLYFEGKDALMHALIDEGMEALYAALSAARAQAGDGAHGQLSALGHAYVRYGLSNPEYYEVMFQLHPERMARYPAESYRRARRNVEIFGEVLSAGAAAGSLRLDTSADVAAGALWTALHGLVSLSLADRIDRRVAGSAFVDAAVAQAIGAFRT